MPALTPKGLTAPRLALLASASAARRSGLAKCGRRRRKRGLRCSPGPGARPGASCSTARASSRLPDEIAIAAARPAIAQVGDEGPVELGKLESAVRSALRRTPPAARFAARSPARWSRCRPAELVVERAPPRRKARETGQTSNFGLNHAENSCRGRPGAANVISGGADQAVKWALPAGHFPSYVPWQGVRRHLHWLTRGRQDASAFSRDACRAVRGLRGPTRTRDERKSPQLRPLGDHRPVAARLIHAVPESRASARPRRTFRSRSS